MAITLRLSFPPGRAGPADGRNLGEFPSSNSKAGIAELRTEIAGLRADLTWRMLAVAGLVIAALRLL